MREGRQRGGQPGNLNALKHGFYSKRFQRGELLDLEQAGDLKEEIGMMRVVARRLLKMSRGCRDLQELIQVLNALGLATTRVAGMMRTLKFLGGGELNEFYAMVDQVIMELNEVWDKDRCAMIFQALTEEVGRTVM